MSKTITSENHKISDQGKTAANQASDAADDMVETTRNSMREGIATTTAAAERLATNGAGQAVEAASRRGTDLTAFWLDVIQEQTTRNIDVLRNITAARGWQEKMEVQNAFFSDNLSRMQDVFSRYMKLVGSTATDLADDGAAGVEKALRAV